MLYKYRLIAFDWIKTLKHGIPSVSVLLDDVLEQSAVAGILGVPESGF
jgi:hypothetical protein